MMDIEKLAREALSYDPETGEVRWKVNRGPAKAGNIAGCQKKDGYWHMQLGGKLVYHHRIAWLLTYGCWPTWHIDHINGNPADNRLCNLREASSAQNQWNAKVRPSAAGVKGIAKRHGRWQARIRVNKKSIHLGVFDTPEEAQRAYIAAADKFAGEFALHNRERFKA